MPLTSLDTLPIGGHARIAAIQGGRNLHRRLMGLGLRVGSEVDVLHHRGRGVVVASAGNDSNSRSVQGQRYSVGAEVVFSDSFESGDTSTWSSTVQ